MKRLIGYFLVGLGYLVLWPIQIGLALYGLFYVITTFLNAGVMAGLISIPITAVILGVIHLVIGAITIPYAGLVAYLLGGRK